VSADFESDVVETPILGKIEVPKAPELLASRLREQILSGAVAEGEFLPTERALGAQTGLGRSTIREALRILQNEGFISVRSGRNGGPVARRPERAFAETSLEHFIRAQQLRMESLVEAREAIEPSAARLAARHREQADLDKLDRAQRELQDAFAAIPRFLRANVNWHLAVVEASHNELLITFMSAIAQAIHAATDLENFNSDERRRAVLNIHRRIGQAIRAGDEDAAERRMRRHVAAYVASVTKVSDVKGLKV
jgi:GntR family transcriptional regulator, transcriptional repressor for pyruvate dehydrogenase complex